ncbi:FtsB family cell division protein [Humibacter albus]|jgi:cell division protein FtsB|uniref:FtsB family cell division protein n=1 Tax=Humibacter albus TaxID=427754 RepID=UPI000478AE75|nr:septum formation initiator family protein [Humibacter albus]
MPASTRRVSASWLRGIRFSWFSLVMLGLVVIGVLVVAPTLHLYVDQQHEIGRLEKNNADTAAKVADLKKQAADWSDPEYIKAQARGRLLFVMPGETSYLVIDDRAPTPQKNQAPVSRDIQATKSDWLGALASSFLTAGTTGATADQLSK